MQLIDHLVHRKTEIVPGLIVISKPKAPSLWYRIQGAWYVLNGKARAVTFAQDFVYR